MRKLISTPNFDELPCLQKLEICRCDDLQEIHPSIGNHRSLKSIKVFGCPNLRMFPTISKMEKLELLDIRYCHKSLEFPDIQSNMESLEEMYLYEIGIGGLLSSIGEHYCTSLISLHLNRLQRLDLVGCCLEDGEIPSAIGEMSNLQELNLSENNFSKLHFSISQLTRLKLLKLNGCKRLLELPQLPSSIAILLANKCDSLTDVGDFYVDCKRLWYASLICSNMVINGNRFLQSMLEGATAENHCVTLHLPKGFTPCLREGWECTLELPENWCSDFCGFLMFAVLKSDLVDSLSPAITIISNNEDDVESDAEDDVVRKESDAEDDVVWKEITWVGYFPFASLRDTEWWDSKYKKLSFSSYTENDDYPSKFGVRLVRRKGGSGPTTETSEEISTDSYSGISYGKDDYTTGFKIESDSKDYLEIYPRDFY